MSFTGKCDFIKPGNADSLHDKMISQVTGELVNSRICKTRLEINLNYNFVTTYYHILK